MIISMTSHLATLALSLAFMGFPSSTADHPDPYNGQHIEYFAQSGCANDTKPSMPYGMYYETCFNVTHISADVIANFDIKSFLFEVPDISALAGTSPFCRVYQNTESNDDSCNGDSFDTLLPSQCLDVTDDRLYYYCTQNATASPDPSPSPTVWWSLLGLDPNPDRFWQGGGFGCCFRCGYGCWTGSSCGQDIEDISSSNCRSSMMEGEWRKGTFAVHLRHGDRLSPGPSNTSGYPSHLIFLRSKKHWQNG